MNTTVEALKKLYVKLGGELTDTYSGIANGVQVGNYANIPDMIQACTQKAGSGGDGSDLPDVTEEDAGKILTVMETGKWNAANPVSNTVYVPFTVTMDGDDFVASTTATFADVQTAVASKKTVVADVSIFDGSTALAPIVAYNPSVDPTVLVFATTYKGSESSDKPILYQIGFSAYSVTFDAVDLT